MSLPILRISLLKFFTWHRSSKVDEVVDEVLSSAEAVGACSTSAAAAVAEVAAAVPASETASTPEDAAISSAV